MSKIFRIYNDINAKNKKEVVAWMEETGDALADNLTIKENPFTNEEIEDFDNLKETLLYCKNIGYPRAKVI